MKQVSLNTTDRSSRFPPGKKRVAVNPETKAFLHFSGSGETKQRAYAWTGTPDQFRNLVEQHPEASAFRLRRSD